MKLNLYHLIHQSHTCIMKGEANEADEPSHKSHKAYKIKNWENRDPWTYYISVVKKSCITLIKISQL